MRSSSFLTGAFLATVLAYEAVVSADPQDHYVAVISRSAVENRLPVKGSPLALASEHSPDKAELSKIDNDLQVKLAKMKELISGIHTGVDKTSKLRAESVKKKFDRLSLTISKLSKEKSRIYEDNVKLRGELQKSLKRLQNLEASLKFEAKRANDNDVKLWFDTKSDEITHFLHSKGVQSYLDPNFSPVMAGITNYGLVLLPLMLASGYLTAHLKDMSLLHALKSINIFEVTYMAFSMCSMVLLLTADPWHGLRHISDINLIFLQIILACCFWPSVCIGLIESFRTRSGEIRRNMLLQLIVRALVAADYGGRVWILVVERSDEQLVVPPHCYVGYLIAALASSKLTGIALRCAGTPVRDRPETEDRTAHVRIPLHLERNDCEQRRPAEIFLAKAQLMMPLGPEQHGD